MALAMAAGGGTMFASPTPRTPNGMPGVRHLDDDRVDHRQIERGGHAVIEQAGVQHGAVRAHVILLVERPADALHAAALHLPLDVAGMDGLAGVLHRGEAQDRDLAGFGIHLDVGDTAGEGAAHALRIHRAAAHHRTAGLTETRGQFAEGERLVAGAEHAALPR